jgi:hypothetical protein
MDIAPVALFAYNRPDHLRRTLDALRQNTLAARTEITVFSDAPKIRALREYLASLEGFRSISIVAREANLGLARSIIGGVTELVARHGRVIVLEDDMVTSPHFLAYMNDGLDLYRDEERVISIAAYTYPVRANLPPAYFLRGADCWGWATWKRGWDLFEPRGETLLRALEERGEAKTFDMDGTYPYLRMLKRQIDGEINSWAIRWYASAFLANKLTLYPGVSMLGNIGNDGAGTHSSATNVFDVRIADRPLELVRQDAKEDPIARAAIAAYFRSTRRSLPALAKRVLAKLALR